MKTFWKRISSVVLIAVLVALILPLLPISAYAYSGGTGTATSPYCKKKTTR